MDFRKVYDGIVDAFDEWRPRYCPEVFADIIAFAALGPGKAVLEIGPGTGQATEPFLQTGCSYLAVELGEHLAAFTKAKFAAYDNFEIVNADFETYDLGHGRFDLVLSAATIQWIPEAVGFPKAFDILKSGGVLAMMMTRSDHKSANEPLYWAIQAVYDAHFHPETEYTCRLNYENTVHYGFVDTQCRRYPKTRTMTADEYVAWIGTNADHITLREPHQSKFFSGIRDAIVAHGNRIEIRDTITLYLARKP